MTEAGKTARYAIIYAFGVFLNRIVSIVMLPIYTRCLSPKDYGTIELLSMTTDIFGLVVGLGITTAIFRFYYKYETQVERNMVISTMTVLCICFYFLAAGSGFLVSDKLASLILEGGKANTIYFQLMFVIFFLQILIEIPLSFIRAQERPYAFVLINAGKLLVQLSLNIYFIVILKMHVMGMLYSTLIAYAIFSVGLVIYTFKAVGLVFDKTLAKEAIIFGAPFIVTNLCEFILTYSDRYFLKAYSGLGNVGLYSLGYKLGFILWAFTVTPFFNIWDYQRFAIAKNADAQEINKKVFLFFSLILISVALGISLFSLDLFKIMSAKEYWSASKIVPIIMIAYMVQAWTAFGSFGILYTGRTKFIAASTFIAAISIIILSFVLIPRYDIYGAAIATAVAFLIRFTFVYKFAQDLYRLLLPWKKVIAIFIVAGTIQIVSLLVQNESLLESIAINSLLYVLFFSVIIISPILNKVEKRYLFELIKYPLRKLQMSRVSGETA